MNHRKIRICVIGSTVTLLRVRSLLGIGVLDLGKRCQRQLLLSEYICIIINGHSALRVQVPSIEALNLAHGALRQWFWAYVVHVAHFVHSVRFAVLIFQILNVSLETFVHLVMKTLPALEIHCFVSKLFNFYELVI